MNKDFIEEEIPKYHKKKGKKENKKSNHKHEYIDCLFLVQEERERINKGNYCKICGKIGKMQFFITKKTEAGSYLVLNNEEIKEMYKDLPIIVINDTFQKNIKD